MRELSEEAATIELGTWRDPLATQHSRSPDRMCLTWVLPPGADRMQVAQRLVQDQLPDWGLQPHRARRWLVSATALLAGLDELDLLLQIDRISQLVTLELWFRGTVVYGIDDWIG